MHGALRGLPLGERKAVSNTSSSSSSAAADSEAEFSGAPSDSPKVPTEAAIQQNYQDFLEASRIAGHNSDVPRGSHDQLQRPLKPLSDFNLWIKPKDALFDFSQTLLLERGKRVRTMEPSGRLQALKAIAACHREKSVSTNNPYGPFLMPLLNLSLSLATSETVHHTAPQNISVSSETSSAPTSNSSSEVDIPSLQHSGQVYLDGMSRGLQSQIESRSWLDGVWDAKHMAQQAQHPSYSIEGRQAHAAQLVHFIARSGIEVSGVARVTMLQ
jgi:hypothetical protein